ncbi:hypothetical protein [Blastopirellula marina]|uniref:Glycosyltransferase RgtA/B/C/D-like domain-containing protein n=1 Tax=Blastopirellula marina TaxID=124 RepID=A0A2S8G6F0_9BACT|nr:hypothetical protein [Blastopirellula marina]PQO40038.1 hypothetical protein C5Y98_06900 [Blastopirellula marina]PTL45413.1 hypothetical protein C5Y97_06900 [Blastopirellula marina]
MGDIYNADSLFPMHVAKDVLFDGSSVGGWTFCPSPFVFPDALLTGFFFGLTGKTILSCFLTSIFFVTMTALGFSYCGRVCGVANSSLRLSLCLLSAAVYLLTVAYGLRFVIYHYMLLPAFHSGAYMVIIWLVGLTVAIIKEKPGTKRYALIGLQALLAFLTATGDPLILPMFVAPATAAALACWYYGMFPRRQLYAPILSMWICSFAGIFVIRRLIFVVPTDSVGSASLQRSAIALFNFTLLFLERLLSGDILHVLGTIWLIACGAMVYAAFQAPKGTDVSEPTDVRGRTAFLFGYMLLSIMAIFAAPIAVGHSALIAPTAYDYVLHYFHPFLFGSIFGLPLVLAAWLDRREMPPQLQAWQIPAAGFSATLILALAMLQIGVGPYSPYAGRTEFVMKVDDLIAKYGLKRGMVEYWRCRQITTMSQSDAQVIPIHTVDLAYLSWMHNSQLMTRHSANSNNFIPFDFIITSGDPGMTYEEVVARFGQPAHYELLEVVRNPPDLSKPLKSRTEIELLVYNRSTDLQFQRLFNSPFHFPGYSHFIAGAELPSAIGNIDQADRVALSDGDSTGFVTFGPYVKLPAGDYAVNVQLAADGETDASVGGWDVLLHSEVTQVAEKLADGEISSGQKEIRHEFTVAPDQNDHLLEARIHLSGKGRIAVKSMELQRLR